MSEQKSLVDSVHIPILGPEIVRALVEPFENAQGSEKTRWFLDCTFGGGGHTALLFEELRLKGLGSYGVIGVDQDSQAIERGEKKFKAEIDSGRCVLHHCRFSEVVSKLSGYEVVGILADLGFSSDQIEDDERGLSFNSDGPLDMRLDRERGESCYQLLKQVREDELADILFNFGEERFSRRIAARIIEARRKNELPTTAKSLAELITRSMPPESRRGRIHPATRSFQALRIAVNEELDELDSLLDRVILELQPGGRVAILSFHSLEDRKVKTKFRTKEGPFRSLHKKPIEASQEETSKNPRARSAKLRIAEKVS